MHSALVAHALVRAVSALVPTPWLPGIQRRRQECRRGTQECVRHLRHLFFPTLCDEVCGKWRRGTHECVRHLRHLFFPTICAEVSGKCRRGTHAASSSRDIVSPSNPGPPAAVRTGTTSAHSCAVLHGTSLSPPVPDRLSTRPESPCGPDR